MNKSLHILWVLLLAASCKTENERQIVGKWQAAQLMECDNVVPIQTDLVDIEFYSNGKYVFHSTLNVKEEGTYRIKKNYLFTQDKLRDKAPEKAVLIQSISDDSLVLQMSYKGKDQWLTLVKEGALEKAREKEEEDAKAKALAAAAAGAGAAIAVATTMNTDSAQKAEEAKKAEEDKKKAEAAAEEKKREEEADRKREAEKKKESSSSSSYKEREAKRKAAERKAKEEAEKKAEKFRREYAKREAERKKKEAAARKKR